MAILLLDGGILPSSFIVNCTYCRVMKVLRGTGVCQCVVENGGRGTCPGTATAWHTQAQPQSDQMTSAPQPATSPAPIPIAISQPAPMFPQTGGMSAIAAAQQGKMTTVPAGQIGGKPVLTTGAASLMEGKTVQPVSARGQQMVMSSGGQVMMSGRQQMVRQGGQPTASVGATTSIGLVAGSLVTHGVRHPRGCAKSMRCFMSNRAISILLGK